MDLWRISNHPDLSGLGGFKRSARWHTRGSAIVYLADSPAGALLETLVHLEIDAEDLPDFYTRIKATAPHDLAITYLDPPDGSDWKTDQQFTRSMGDAWRIAQATCLARVPSAITDGTWNYLLNPEHPDASRIQITAIGQHQYDTRLFRSGIPRGK